MSEENKKQLESQLWNIANELRGKMDADEFRDYILGFIFYKYLSEKMNIYANNLLKEDNLLYKDIDENSSDGKEYLEAVEEESIETLGYYLKPSQLFSFIASRNKISIEELEKTLNNIESSTMGSESEDDFGYDARNEEYVNMFDSGIIDPAKVSRVAVENASSISGLLLTTEVAITDKPEENPEPTPPMNPGMMM